MENRKKPCKECPFRRDNTLPKDGKPGGSPVMTYVGQIVGPFWLPCHSDKNYAGKRSDTNKVSQCAGAAIYRTNIGVDKKMPEGIFLLPKDEELVFKNHGEFINHFIPNVKVEDANKVIKEFNLEEYHLKLEMENVNVKKLKL
jgi:hypothetical protein